MSYHRPRVYRSLHGCCICKAKSSSSRFTDSSRYKDAFTLCFDLTEKREGDICNACVLLVKRFRKLPEKSKKNWSHVVDARAGPGVKSFVRKPRRPPDITPKKKHVYRRRHKRKAAGDCGDESPPRRRLRNSSPFPRTDSPLSVISDSNRDELMLEATGSSRAGTPDSRAGTPSSAVGGRAMSASPAPSSGPTGPRSRKRLKLDKEEESFADIICGFFDPSMWKREETCCGAVFRGPFGEVMIDPRFYTPCSDRPHHRTRPILDYLKAGPPLAEDKLASTKLASLSNGLCSVSSEDTVNDSAAAIPVTPELLPGAVSIHSENRLETSSPTTTSTSPSCMKPVTSSSTSSSSSSSPQYSGAASKASSVVSTTTSFESLIESELKAFGLEAENGNEDDMEPIDFYCNENMESMKAAGASSEDIDEGFFDKPPRQEKLRLSCDSPSQLSL